MQSAQNDSFDTSLLLGGGAQSRLYPLYAQLRESAPVLWVPEMGHWLVSRYDDVRAILLTPEIFSSYYPERFGTGLAVMSPKTERTEAALAKGYPWMPTLLFRDDPEHQRHRALLQKALSPKSVRHTEVSIAEICNSLIDQFEHTGVVNFVRDFAMPLPISVLANALGIKGADKERFKKWSDNIVYRLGAAMEENQNVALVEDYVEFQHYMVERIEERRGKPDDELLSAIVNAHYELEGATELSVPELLGILTLLLAGGNDTTTATMASLLYRMVRDPELMATLRARPELIPSAIEETLRLESPLQMFPRKVMLDTNIAGVTIKAGDMVMAMFGSANRDPNHWEDPEVFRLNRPNIRDHLAFSGGPHYCAGAMLTKAEMRIGMTTLLNRIESIELAEDREPDFYPNLLTRAYLELPLRISAPLEPRT